jgi:5-methylcytosine-specific restriction endonuclease McrA
MGVFIKIGTAITFASNVGVLVNRPALEMRPDELASAIAQAWRYMDDPDLVEACSGNGNLLSTHFELTFEEFLALKQQIAAQTATSDAKRRHTRVRRREFNAIRSQLVLEMIEAGIPYLCSAPGCTVTRELTIDHVTPLSRGGTDSIENLQFLCRSHNSLKGDRPTD